MSQKIQNLKPIIHLRVVRGKPSFDESGKMTNENWLMKLQHNTTEWANYLATIRFKGLGKATVEKVIYWDGKAETPASSEVIEAVKAEVEAAFKGPKVELTPEQQEIARLREMVENLSKGQLSRQEAAKVPVKANGSDPDLAKARKEFKAVTGEKADANLTAAEINAKLAELAK